METFQEMSSLYCIFCTTNIYFQPPCFYCNKLVTIVEGNQKAPFSILHQGVGEDATPFPRLLHFTLDMYLILLSVSKEVSSTIFKVFGMTQPGIEPGSPGPFANTLPTWLMRVFGSPSTKVTNFTFITIINLNNFWIIFKLFLINIKCPKIVFVFNDFKINCEHVEILVKFLVFYSLIN